MSLILDALNRADQERTSENHSPSIQTSHSPAPVSANPIGRWLIESAIIGLALAAFLYSQWFGQATSLSDTKTAQADIQSQPIPLVSKTRVEPTTAEATAAATATKHNPPAMQQSVTTPTVIRPQTANAVIASLYQQQPAAPTNNNSMPTASAPKKPLSETESSQAILLQIPLLIELPARFQRSVPTINYEIHVYSDNQRAGFVKLNGAIRKIGAEIEPGLRVVAILKDSLVLDYNDTQFRLTALNSWMNFK
jgi:hypothetical protein